MPHAVDRGVNRCLVEAPLLGDAPGFLGLAPPL
jgi:hypothetical protein